MMHKIICFFLKRLLLSGNDCTELQCDKSYVIKKSSYDVEILVDFVQFKLTNRLDDCFIQWNQE